MILLALDLATRLGFAVGDVDSHVCATGLEAAGRAPLPKPASGAVRIGPTGAPIGDFLVAYDRWLRETIQTTRPTHLVFEAPWVGPKTHQDTARKLMCLAGLTEMIGTQAGIGWIRECRVNDPRKHFTGRGSGPRAQMKALVMECCRARGWEVEGDDEADALALFDYAAHLLQQRQRRAA